MGFGKNSKVYLTHLNTFQLNYRHNLWSQDGKSHKGNFILVIFVFNLNFEFKDKQNKHLNMLMRNSEILDFLKIQT